MSDPVPSPARRQIGIVPSLLLSSLGAVVIAVIAVQAWTLHVVAQQQRAIAQQALDVELRLLTHTLGAEDGVWQAGPDGLILNGRPLSDAAQAVATLHAISGAASAIFAGDRRIATSIRTLGWTEAGRHPA